MVRRQFSNIQCGLQICHLLARHLIYRLDTGYAKATNIYKETIANATDEAHAMVGAYNSLGQKIKATNDQVMNMQCSVHRAAVCS